MKWAVEVIDTLGDERLLTEVLKALGFDLTKDSQGDVVLTGEELHAADDANKIWNIAKKVSSSICDVVRISGNVQSGIGFTVGSVYEYSSGGNRRSHAFMEVSNSVTIRSSIQAELTTGPSTLSAEEQKEAESRRKEDEYQRDLHAFISKVVPVHKTERAVDVLTLLNGKLTPFTMGHIFELVNDDMNGNMTIFTSSTQVTRFKRSINHPLVNGLDARHAISNVAPPPKPMREVEAQSFVKDLANKWFDHKTQELGKTT